MTRHSKISSDRPVCGLQRTWESRRARPIDRRRTPEYEEKRAALDDRLKLELDLVEDRILAEGDHPFRRIRPDGSVLDLSSYDAAGVIVEYLPSDDGNHLFLDFVIHS